jgi:hypothetical protein
MEEQNSVFRKKTLERISSPEQLTDYLRVTGPGIWITLIIVMLLLGSLFVWAAIGTLETTADVRVDVKQHNAVIIAPGGEKLEEGMPLRLSGQETAIASAKTDKYGRSVGVAEVRLPDGTYDGAVVTETVHAIDFLVESR